MEAEAVKEPEGADAETVDDEREDDKIEDMLETTQAQDFCLESITPCVPIRAHQTVVFRRVFLDIFASFTFDKAVSKPERPPSRRLPEI